VDSLNLCLPSPLVELHDERLPAREVRLYFKRDDLIHPDLSGNKWRKLKYNEDYSKPLCEREEE
jgi:1-aminocyclopropane-1-carboxylate deaminase